jgi:hypothetical protein
VYLRLERRLLHVRVRTDFTAAGRIDYWSDDRFRKAGWP